MKTKLTFLMLLISFAAFGQKNTVHFKPDYYDDYTFNKEVYEQPKDTVLFVLQNADTLAKVQFLVFNFENGIIAVLDKELEVLGNLYFTEKDNAIFISTDPMWHKYPSHTPYNYCGNNPIMITDPTGKAWVKGDDGNVFWDKNTNSMEDFNKNYAGKNDFFYVSDANNPNAYSMPNGSAKLIMNQWVEGVENGGGGASINMEFKPSNTNNGESGWIQTFSSNIPDFSNSNYNTALPQSVISERLDGGGMSGKSGVSQAVFFDSPPSNVLNDSPFRVLNNGAERSVIWKAQSTMVVNGVPAVSVGWGFSINTDKSGSYSVPTILNSTTPFHKQAITNALINYKK